MYSLYLFRTPCIRFIIAYLAYTVGIHPPRIAAAGSSTTLGIDPPFPSNFNSGFWADAALNPITGVAQDRYLSPGAPNECSSLSSNHKYGHRTFDNSQEARLLSSLLNWPFFPTGLKLIDPAGPLSLSMHCGNARPGCLTSDKLSSLSESGIHNQKKPHKRAGNKAPSIADCNGWRWHYRSTIE